MVVHLRQHITLQLCCVRGRVLTLDCEVEAARQRTLQHRAHGRQWGLRDGRYAWQLVLWDAPVVRVAGGLGDALQRRFVGAGLFREARLQNFIQAAEPVLRALNCDDLAPLLHFWQLNPGHGRDFDLSILPSRMFIFHLRIF